MSILEVKKINKSLSWKKVLNNVSFSVKPWEIYGFLWSNWAWKTTTIKCIMRFIEPESWEIQIFGESWLGIKSKKLIGFMPESTYLYKHLTWEEFLRFNGAFFNISKKQLDSRIEELLKKVWLELDSKKYLSEYSKWMLQRILLAQSVINKPKLLFLDEPMSWLDPIGRKMVKNLLIELKSAWNTIFFNTHILADVESICDRISIIHKWNIIVNGEEIFKIKDSLEKFFIKKIEEN